jgi:uncharacterized OsmC-like protein
MTDTEEIGKAIGQAVEYLSQHPDEARYTDSEAVATLEGALRVTVRDSLGHEVTTDMPESIGGNEAAPSAGWLFRAALAACDTTLIAMRAAMLGVELTTVQIAVDGESNDLGILGIDGSVPAGPLSLRARVVISAKDTEEKQLREIVEWAVDHCPVNDAATRAVPVTVEIKARNVGSGRPASRSSRP